MAKDSRATAPPPRPPFKQISLVEVGAAWQHGYAERLMRTIQEEEGQLPENVDDRWIQ